VSHFEIILTGFFTLVFVGLAPLKAQAQDRYPAALYNSRISAEPTLPAELVAAYEQAKKMEKTDYSEFVPKGLSDGMNQKAALSKVADSTFKAWWDNSVRDTPVGKSVDHVEKSMKQELIISDSTEIKHKVNFQFLPFQTTAKMDYSGYIDASLFYVASETKTGIEIFKRVFSQDLVVGHEIVPGDERNRVSLRWTW
jgi:hypothetical protein